VFASIPDLLRLVIVPVLGWAAWRDVETRRVPNRTWLPLAALGVVLLLWDGATVLTSAGGFERRLFLVRVAVSLGFIAPLSYMFWRLGGFGGADAKAFIVVAVLLPTFPTYHLLGVTLPVQQTALGVFSFTVLTNTVLVGALYPVALLARNALAGRFSLAMVVGVPVSWDSIPTRHGRLLETPAGLTRGGLDLDALRMYLRWRGETLASLRADAETLRNPATLPADPNPPTDGAVSASSDAAEPTADRSVDRRVDRPKSNDGGELADPWGAETFLADIDHGAYGTTPGDLRDGLDLLAQRDVVWLSPGIPFLVPLFVGLLVAFTYGDLLFGLLGLF